MDNLDNHWLVGIRNESLTTFFKLFPYLANDYFYVIALSILYWAYPRNKNFIDLGFLVPIATLINIIIKNIYSIPRPHASLHLVPFHIDYGFPSGDVQVAAVFWGIIFMQTCSIYLRILSMSIVIGISLSRVYLGVHSIIDVIGGLIFGGIILYIYNTDYFQLLREKWFKDSVRSYWYAALSLILIYLLTLSTSPISNIALDSIGVLIGFGVSIKYIGTNENKKGMNILQIVFSLVILFIFYKFLPISKAHHILGYASIIIKYAILAIMIYTALPRFRHKFTMKSLSLPPK